MKNPVAFPHSHLGINRGELSYEDSDYEDGMSLRDYFAARAIQGICAAMAHPQSIAPWPDNVSEAAAKAYEIADALLVRREQGSGVSNPNLSGDNKASPLPRPDGESASTMKLNTIAPKNSTEGSNPSLTALATDAESDKSPTNNLFVYFINRSGQRSLGDWYSDLRVLPDNGLENWIIGYVVKPNTRALT